MEDKPNLYCYFGSFGTSSKLDIPGHSFYQIGLLDSIRKTYGDGRQFNVFSYIEDVEPMSANFPFADALGEMMAMWADTNINIIEHDAGLVLSNISGKKYNKIFLKARFRNLSTLTKKYKDTLMFEAILGTIISTGFPLENVFIVDTDLSLPQNFIEYLKETGIQVVIPSIDFPGISSEIAESFINYNEGTIKFSNTRNNLLDVIFYGNIDSSNYKQGQEKSNLLLPILKSTQKIRTLAGLGPLLSIVTKRTMEISNEFKESVMMVGRHDRETAWLRFSKSDICLNVTKDKYDSIKFIPARLYESIIFGCIPVSYKFEWLDPALSFKDEIEYSEIIKFLMEITPQERAKLYAKLARKIAQVKR